MKANKLSYEEQVLMLGDGTILEPGCYDEASTSTARKTASSTCTARADTLNSAFCTMQTTRVPKYSAD